MMDNLVNLNITKIVIIEIMEVGKGGIRTIFVVKKKGIKGMIIQYGKKHFKNDNNNFQPEVGVNVAIVE